jgi:ABC-type multidrug transport system permease subunit
MIRIFDIASKDLLQLLRDRKIFMFLLIMPIAFTLLFGFASGAFSRGGTDPRLPVGFLDEDHSRISRSLHDLLAASEIIRLEQGKASTTADLENLVAGEKLAAVIIVPSGYGHKVLDGKPAKLTLIADSGATAGMSVESEALAAAIHLDSAVRTAMIMEQVAPDKDPFDYTYEQALAAWQEPPIRVTETPSSAIEKQAGGVQTLSHTSPGMMLQFAIAGLLTCAQILVTERRSRCLQRLLTTATSRLHILLGHFLAIFVLIFCQFLLLISFGQFALRVNYLSAPGATLLVAFSAALCIAALGLLIGTLAKNEEQAIIFSLVPMFVLGGIGGAMVPLEVTGRTFQTIGHVSPVAWAMDGFKNILLRGQGLESALLPSVALVGYAALFFVLAARRLSTAEEK